MSLCLRVLCQQQNVLMLYVENLMLLPNATTWLETVSDHFCLFSISSDDRLYFLDFVVKCRWKVNFWFV
jgi:hypothetical protein